jgi:hypothetical protein
MEPVVISQADYQAGNYPKDVPIMVGMDVGMEGKGGMDMGKKIPTKITVTIKPA